LEKTVLKSNRSNTAGSQTKPDDWSSGLIQSWSRFWFTPTSPFGLHALRILTGLLFVFWLMVLAGNQTAFFGLAGWVDRETASNLREDFRNSWSILYLFDSNASWVNTVYWAGILLFILFALGLCTRVTSVLTWVVVVSFIANPVSRLDAEPLLGILAFYLMIGYLLLGQWSRNVSWQERILGSNRTFLLGRDEQPPSVAANFAIRLLQVHFAVVVVTSGLHKLQSGDWWAGAAFWYPMHPPFETTADSLFAEREHASRQLFFLSLTQYIFLAWEIGFPLFAWRKSWRPVLLGGTLIGWIGCLAIYKQPLFGPIYCICALSYLTPAEWQAISDKLNLAKEWFAARNGNARIRHGSGIS
jgi:hypothetical protein